MERWRNLLNKIRIHVKDLSENPQLAFVFNKFLAITLRRLGFEEWMIDSERFLYRYMKPLHNGCFVDVGAGFGIWTFFVAKRGYIVHAFEPVQNLMVF
jgi:tRNA1(Val) A37 N6-methylase TrmN6